MSTTLEITSTYYQSPLGLLRIGGSDTYISEISFVDHLDEPDYQRPGLSGALPPIQRPPAPPLPPTAATISPSSSPAIASSAASAISSAMPAGSGEKNG